MRTGSFIGLGALAATVLASPALAEDPREASVQLSGTAAAICGVSDGFSAIDVGNMVNTATGGLDATKVNGKTSANAGRIFCNGVNSTLKLTATAITASAALPTGAGAAGFANSVDYTATATLSSTGYSSQGAAISIVDTTTAEGPGPETKVGLLSASSGQLIVTLSAAALPSGKNFLMANDGYKGSVTLTLDAVV